MKIVTLFVTFIGIAITLSPYGYSEPGSIAIDKFGGISNSDLPASIGPNDAQDLLNVEANTTGTAIKKRQGVTREQTLTYSSSAVNGSTVFYDDNGNKIRVVCHDVHCAKSTNGGAFSNFITTAPTGVKRWSFVATQGDLYGANDQRGAVFKYDGTNLTHPSEIPAGSILELSTDRLLVGDQAASPNRVSKSKSGDFSEFTAGVNSVDPYNDDFGSPGQKITGIKCDQGICLYFKTDSIITCIEGDQYTTSCAPASNSIGTSDPASITAGPEGFYFRGTDRNYWRLRGERLENLSVHISSFIARNTVGSEQTNTQTGQSDWALGLQIGSGTWNVTTTPGSVLPSSVTFVDTSSSNWAAGTLNTYLSTVASAGSITLSTAAHRIYNGDFETGDLTYWTCATGSGSDSCSVTTAKAINGTYGAGATASPCLGGQAAVVRLLTPSDAIVYSFQNLGSVNSLLTGTSLPSCSPANTPQNCTIDIAAQGLSSQTLKIQFEAYGGSGGGQAILTSSTFTAISSITYLSVAGGCATSQWSKLDDVKVNRYFAIEQSSQVTNFLSQSFDTTFSTTIGGTFTVSSNTPVGTSLAFQIRSSADNSIWSTWASINSLSRSTQTSRYWQYNSSFTTHVGTATPRLDDVTLIAATTGQFVTQCIQPPSQITSFGVLVCSEQKTGNASIVYAATSAATCAAIGSGSVFTNQTNNAAITIATNTAVLLRFTSLLTSATEQAQIDACVIYWNNGNPPMPVWGIYNPVKNAVFWTASIDGSTTTNRMLKYDLNLEGSGLSPWFPQGLSINAPLFSNGAFMGGESTGGYWDSIFVDGVSADIGQSINSYWKSKDFSGDPFRTTKWETVSLIARNQSSGNMTVTATKSDQIADSYTVSLSTSMGTPYVRSNRNLLNMGSHNFLNLKLGNNSTTPFEILGLRVGFFTDAWLPINP